jgi:hypothetical protein
MTKNSNNLSACFDLILWYGFTFIGVYYSRLYMNQLFDPHSFTFVILGYGALLKFLNIDFELIKSELSAYVHLSILNIASVLLSTISIGETTVGFFYVTKVFFFQFNSNVDIFFIIFKYLANRTYYPSFIFIYFDWEKNKF